MKQRFPGSPPRLRIPSEARRYTEWPTRKDLQSLTLSPSLLVDSDMSTNVSSCRSSATFSPPGQSFEASGSAVGAPSVEPTYQHELQGILEHAHLRELRKFRSRQLFFESCPAVHLQRATSSLHWGRSRTWNPTTVCFLQGS